MLCSSDFVFGEQIMQFLDSQGFMDYLDRVVASTDNSNNLLDKLQDAIGRGQNPMSILPSSSGDPEILTIVDSDAAISGNFTLLFSQSFN